MTKETVTDFHFPKVHISVEDRKRYASYSFNSIFGLKLIQVLPTEFLMQCLNVSGDEHEALRVHIGGVIINPRWVTEAVAEELYLTRHAISKAMFETVID